MYQSSDCFFADDSLLFFEVNGIEPVEVNNILQLYEMASGQSVNLAKSQLFFSTNVDTNIRNRVSSQLLVESSLNLGKYLGLPYLICRSKRKVFAFLKDKVWRCLQYWNKKFLSRAFKEILLKTVAQALLNYTMGVFLLPMTLCSDLEKMMNSFW